ncbi:MAG: DUF1320 domain-containing protein [Nitrospirae bacterium]|nr:DUF1320 domain-containing protein [Nitrospirota bacterium]
MYITATDIYAVIKEAAAIELTDDENTGSVNVDFVNSAITKSDGVIDSYLATRYKLPLSIVPDVIKSVAVTLTVYNLYQRSSLEVDEKTKKAYTDAVSLLKDISKGAASLGLQETSAGLAQSNKTTNGRVFTIDKLRSY